MTLDTSGPSAALAPRRSGRLELLVSLAIAAISCILAALIGMHVMRGDTKEFDERWGGQVQQVRKNLDERRLVVVNHAFDEITDLGGTTAMCIFGAFVATFMILSRLYMPALALLATMASAGALDYALKEWIQRKRPMTAPEYMLSSFSFPSGHATVSMAFYVALGLCLARLAPTLRARAFAVLAGFLLALMICFSRVWNGVHYPTDVIAGALIGLALALFVHAAVVFHAPKNTQ